jgi:competence protein ComEC
LVRFPNGGTLLVDAGGLSSPSSFDVGDRVVAPVLRDAGVRRVQSLALTHGDADHVGGAPSILREFKPYDVWEGIPVPRLGALADLRETTSRGGIRWVNVQRGDTMAIDGVQVIVRHPAVAEWERQRVRNDDSIVIELLWRQVSIVLTGDIGKEAEHAVAPHFEPARLRIVKVPHHGSRSSSTPEFVGALQPRIAVVSAGRGNRFGHPAQAVLDRYRRAGAAMFRTDRDGAVTVETDGEAVEVTTYTGRRFRAG